MAAWNDVKPPCLVAHDHVYSSLQTRRRKNHSDKKKFFLNTRAFEEIVEPDNDGRK